MRLLYICRAIVLAGLLMASNATAGMIRDTEIEAGLTKLAAPLIAAAGYAPDAVKLRVIIDPSYNAFVAGEMTIYIHSGLLTEARSGEEILGVIAHELGHLKAGHVPRRDEALREASGAGALATIAALALAAGGAPADATIGVMIGGSDQINRQLLRGFRRDESVADEFGLRFLDTARVSSRGLAEMMRRLAAQRALPENRQSQYYQTHPGAADRLAVYNDHLQQSSLTNSQLADRPRQLMTRITDKLRAYSAPPQQTIANLSALAAANRDYGLAIAQFRRGDLQAALTIMDHKTADQPDDAFFHEFRGDILMSLAQPVAAAIAYETAIKLRPDSPQILLNLGRALVATQDKARLSRAIAALELAVRGEPGWAFAHRQLAIAYGRAGQIAAADITLADEAVLRQDKQQAIRMARRVIKRPEIAADIRNRANDILFRFGAAE